jgi:hypothetical protein
LKEDQTTHVLGEDRREDMESILTSIKKLLGMTEEYTAFDDDIIMHINSVFMVLRQMGVGPEEGFYIEDKDATWEDYIEDPLLWHGVKSYMYAKVRLIFDPPQNSSHIKCLEQTISEFEWRLNFQAETS